MKFTFTPVDKALVALLLPLIGTAIQAYAGGASLRVVVIGLVTSVATAVGVYLKANAG